MAKLVRNRSCTVPDIAADLGFSRQFVQTVCNGLISQGLVTTGVNPWHKRSKLLSPTEAGLNLFHHAQREENLIIERILPHMDSIAVANTTGLLSTILHAIDTENRE